MHVMENLINVSKVPSKESTCTAVWELEVFRFVFTEVGERQTSIRCSLIYASLGCFLYVS